MKTIVVKSTYRGARKLAAALSVAFGAENVRLDEKQRRVLVRKGKYRTEKAVSDLCAIVEAAVTTR